MRETAALAGDRVMTALSRRIPITLLCDLAEPDGPHSRTIYGSEGRTGAARHDPRARHDNDGIATLASAG
jgi:hypothetical protein